MKLSDLEQVTQLAISYKTAKTQLAWHLKNVEEWEQKIIEYQTNFFGFGVEVDDVEEIKVGGTE